MLTGLVIRELVGADVGDNLLAAYIALGDLGGLTVPEAKNLFREILDPDERIYAAVLDGAVLGAATLTTRRTFLHAGARMGRIEEVAVRPEWQRKGVGTALVLRLVEEARAMGCYKVTLACKLSLSSFYSRCGFAEHEIEMRLGL